jgi:RHS repeat-associated protein
MGSWAFSYDTLNRLSGAADSQPANPNTSYCWSYDGFGNRQQQAGSNHAFTNAVGAAACTAAGGASFNNAWASYNAKNQITGTPTGAPAYDPSGAGNVIADSVNQYLYDAEGRICAVKNIAVGTMTGYIYDAGGTRVAKGSITAWSCNPAANGFTAASDYILGPSGEQAAEMSVSSGGVATWQHTNVFAGGALIATYDATGPHYYLNDPLGTRRVQTNYAGVVEQTCASLPYGDGLSCTGSITSPTEHHFTGKERDAESGNDYYFARYYSSSMGRFMSPDWSAKVEPVPYAKLDNPQSLNLYAYVMNNPMTRFDPDGHGCNNPWTRMVCEKFEKVLEMIQPDPPPPPLPAPPPATIAANTKTGVVVIYHQLTGKAETLDATGNKKDIGTGYAGHGSGVNNPDNQYVQGANAGPPPQGMYNIGPMGSYTIKSGPHKGEVLSDAMTLTPTPGTFMGNPPRGGLLIHNGDFKNMTSSTGCEVLPTETRHAISTSGATQEEVTQ